MSRLVRHFLSGTVIFSICLLAILGLFSSLALAQESPPFEINVIPQAEYAMAGQPFTYTIVVTNVGQTPIKDVFIKAETPPETTFLDTNYTDVNWNIRGVRPGESGEIYLFTQEPVQPEQVVIFELILNVPPTFNQRELVLEGYTLAIDNIENVLVSGPSVKTPLLTATPTATTLPLTSPSPSVFTTSPPSTPTVQVTSAAQSTLLTATPVVTPADDANSVSQSSVPSNRVPLKTSIVFAFVIIGLSVLAGIFVLMRFLKKR